MADQDRLEFIAKEHHKSVDDMRKWGVKFLKVRGKEVRTGKGLFSGGEVNPNIWVDGGPIQYLGVLKAQSSRSELISSIGL